MMNKDEGIDKKFYIIEILEDYASVVNDNNYRKGGKHYVFELDGYYYFPEQDLDSMPIRYAKKLYKITFTEI